MRMRRQTRAIVAGVALGLIFALAAGRAQQPKPMSEDDRQSVSMMLKLAHEEVQKHYYDTKFHGVDLEARYQQYQARLGKVQSLSEGFRVVAAFLSGLKDSHLFFVPPARNNRYDMGYQYALIGNDAFVTRVRPGSDAAGKLHVGDQILQQDGYNVNREDFHDLQYFYNILAPRQAVQLTLRSPGGEQRQATVNARVTAGRQMMDLTQDMDFWSVMRKDMEDDEATHARIIEQGDVAIWRLHEFNVEEIELGHYIGVARKHAVLILDMRGNPGGMVDSLRYIAGRLFENEVKIADRKGRKKDLKPIVSHKTGSVYTGKLIVLVDAGSASCAEVLARVVQLEHRGTVIGDKTMGAVMEALYYGENPGGERKVFYGYEITEANLVMSDGKSLEGTGVTPDEVVLPTAADLAAGRDPAMARAVELAGLKLDAAEAGKLFPYKWPPLD